MTLQTSVDAYRHPDNDGILPDHLRLDGIATLIHNNAKHRVRDLHSPWVHRVAGMVTTWDASEDDETPFCHLQGYSPPIYHFDGNRNQGDDAHRNRGGADGRYGLRTPCPPPNKPQGWFTRPDQRRCAYKPGVQCDAYKRIGTTPLTAICWRSPSTSIDIPRTSPLTNALPSNLAGSRNIRQNLDNLHEPHGRSCRPIAITTTSLPTTLTRLWTGNAGLIWITAI
jgi:hypothetical protein